MPSMQAMPFASLRKLNDRSGCTKMSRSCNTPRILATVDWYNWAISSVRLGAAAAALVAAVAPSDGAVDVVAAVANARRTALMASARNSRKLRK